MAEQDEAQFQADLKRALELSLETAALETARRDTPQTGECETCASLLYHIVSTTLECNITKSPSSLFPSFTSERQKIDYLCGGLKSLVNISVDKILPRPALAQFSPEGTITVHPVDWASPEHLSGNSPSSPPLSVHHQTDLH